MSISWRQTATTFSGEANGFRFTYGTVDFRSFWWSAFEDSPDPLPSHTRRGWTTSESGARDACETALAELKTKKVPRPRRSA